MSELEVIRIEPLDLPKEVVWRFSAMSHVSSMKDFIVYVCDKENKMYVNSSVPQKDIKKFIEVITFPDYWVDDEDGGMGCFLEYVYNTYGFPAYITLIDSHKWRLDREEECKAKEKAGAIKPLLDEIANSEHPAINYNEKLIYEIKEAGSNCGMKTSGAKIGYDDIYIFYLGYLAGSGVVNTDDYHLNSDENILDYYYKISEMLEHIDIQEMPRIYGHLKEMYFSGEQGLG